MSTPLLEIKNLHVRIEDQPEVEILRGIDLTIQEGEVHSIMGPNGSGKSTLAQVLAGKEDYEITEGQILFKGEALPPSYKQRSKEQLRQAQMIYQMADTALNPKLKIRDLIGRPAQMYLGLNGKQLEDRIKDLLNLIELEPNDYIDRLPSELSGGQKQRIGIARALAAEPQFIICDEVTSALDQLVAEGILKLLDKLQGEFDLAYMFITHDLATVKAIADSIAVMHRGKAVRYGTKTEVLSPPFDDYTDLLLSSAPQMKLGWLEEVIAGRRMESAGN